MKKYNVLMIEDRNKTKSKTNFFFYFYFFYYWVSIERIKAIYLCDPRFFFISKHCFHQLTPYQSIQLISTKYFVKMKIFFSKNKICVLASAPSFIAIYYKYFQSNFYKNCFFFFTFQIYDSNL